LYFMDLYSMQLSKLMRIALAALTLLAEVCMAQTPTVLSAPGRPLVFELPASAVITRQLSPVTAAKLATAAQHHQHGLAYPLWLSDANFNVKTRARERQSITVETQRGNPELTTDLLLSLNNNGVRTLVPTTLIFDKLHTFAALPNPPTGQSALQSIVSEFSAVQKTPSPIVFPPTPSIAEQAPVATAYPVRSVDSENDTKSNATARSINRNIQSNRTNVAKLQQKPAVEPPAAVASQATVDKPSQPASAAAPMPSGLPARPTNFSPAQPKPMPEPSWMEDWTLLAGASAGLLLLVYLVTRLLTRLLKKNSKLSNFKQTQSPHEQVANTVFGMSDTEAEAMHKKWLSEQLLSKTDK
jgi:hypothetical protein